MPRGFYIRNKDMKTGKYIRTENTKKKISENHYLKGKHHSEDWKKKVKATKEKNGSYKHTEECNRKISKSLKKDWDENRDKYKDRIKKQAETLKKLYKEDKLKSWMLGKHHTDKTKEKLRQARKKQKLQTYHTKPELKFCRIIRRHNLPYKFTGDGSFWIENINPDFVQTNGKKICIEVFGDYWHKYPTGTERDALKLETLQKYGWQRIVFWEYELMKK